MYIVQNLNAMKNTNAKKAMKAAWTNWKAGRYTNWSECLKSAWKWVKAQSGTIKISTGDNDYRITEKAICINKKWYPLSIITLNTIEGTNLLDSINVPVWFFKSNAVTKAKMRGLV